LRAYSFVYCQRRSHSVMENPDGGRAPNMGQ
jgi:hypothetical protein